MRLIYCVRIASKNKITQVFLSLLSMECMWDDIGNVKGRFPEGSRLFMCRGITR